MSSTTEAARPAEQTAPNLTALARDYQQPNTLRSLGEVGGTLGVFLALIVLMYRAASPWTVLALAVPAGVAHLRLFILQHDLGHGSLFRSRRVNDAIGVVFGIVTFVPFFHWKRIHRDHHAHSGNLDLRGPGCVTMHTVAEYQKLSTAEQRRFRLYRHPAIVLLFGGLYHFLYIQRFAYDAPPTWTREHRNVAATNVALLVLFAALVFAAGWARVLLVHIPVLYLSSTSVIWIFLTQHAFEHGYWTHGAEWSFETAALDGSSYYRLPAVLDWLTASVGHHHVHHLNPRIPSYQLRRCHNAITAHHEVRPLPLRAAFDALRLTLWDEHAGRLVSFATQRHT